MRIVKWLAIGLVGLIVIALGAVFVIASSIDPNQYKPQIVEAAIGRLGAEWIYELVASGNVASRRMVEASGLRLDPMLVCGIASQGGARYTR